MKIGFATISIKSEAFRTQIFSLIDADIKIEFLLIVGFEKKEIKNSTKERILRKFYSILIPSVKLIKVKEKGSKLSMNSISNISSWNHNFVNLNRLNKNLATKKNPSTWKVNAKKSFSGDVQTMFNKAILKAHTRENNKIQKIGA